MSNRSLGGRLIASGKRGYNRAKIRDLHPHAGRRKGYKKNLYLRTYTKNITNITEDRKSVKQEGVVMNKGRRIFKPLTLPFDKYYQIISKK